MRRRGFPVLLMSLLACAGAHAQIWDPRALDIDPLKATAPIAPLLDGLGDHHHAVTTANPDSQKFFDQGLRLTVAFNHSEAVRAFKEAIRLDPRNAMAYWGWAYALGPNLNLPMQPEVIAQAFDASRRALALTDSVTPAERDYIEALAARYAADPNADRAALDKAYAEAMGQVAARYPDDPDAAALYAEALMNRSPWNYWEPDGGPRENTPVILQTLESVLVRYPNHPAAIHLYIHAVEARFPDRAVAAADRLGALMPGAGHIVHMPSHIYMGVGRYADAVRVNQLADAADDAYVANCHAQGFYLFGYHRHNEHFITWAAMLDGESAVAMAAARKIGKRLPPEMATGPFGETVQHLLSQPLYVLVRFGRWQEVLNEPRPPPGFAVMTGLWHYARGLAFRHTAGRLADAARELQALRRLAMSRELQQREVGFAPAPVVLEIATEVLAAELASARGQHGVAIGHLDRAVRLQDGLTYNEPPDWYFPVRHYLGAELLEAGRPAEAATVYWQDLARNRENGYALFGLQQALAAQHRDAEAAEVAARFRAAWRSADVTLRSSRF
jgi:tetratricopeptide (TPR) repeat protein